jgi:hypothetical protein
MTHMVSREGREANGANAARVKYFHFAISWRCI